MAAHKLLECLLCPPACLITAVIRPRHPAKPASSSPAHSPVTWLTAQRPQVVNAGLSGQSTIANLWPAGLRVHSGGGAAARAVLGRAGRCKKGQSWMQQGGRPVALAHMPPDYHYQPGPPQLQPHAASKLAAAGIHQIEHRREQTVVVAQPCLEGAGRGVSRSQVALQSTAWRMRTPISAVSNRRTQAAALLLADAHMPGWPPCELAGHSRWHCRSHRCTHPPRRW